MLSRLNIGSAFRYSRNIVGGLTGFLFSIGLFKAPLGGKGAFSFIGALGTLIFICRSIKSYKHPNLSQGVERYRSNKDRNSVVYIATELAKDRQKTKAFLKKICPAEAINTNKVIIISSGLRDLENDEIFINDSTENIQNILMASLRSAEKESFSAHLTFKHLHCTASSLIQIGGHFMECLLARAYYDPSLFNFDEFSADNIIIIIIALLSLYNGLQIFHETKKGYEEKPSTDELCEKFLTAYHTFSLTPA